MSDTDILAIASIVMADEEKIRADERTKVFKWLSQKDYLWQCEYIYGEMNGQELFAIDVMNEYKKENGYE